MKRNGFCFLCDTLPTRISENVLIDTKTSTAIAVLLYFDGDHTGNEKAEYSCQKLFGLSLSEVIKKTGFTEAQIYKKVVKYLCGYPKAHSLTAEGEKTPDKPLPKRRKQTTSFDYIQDSDAIMSAFKQVYGMSLQEVKDLHWWEFSALFANLSDQNCSFVYKVATRQEEIPKKATPEQRQQIQKRKQAVALVDVRSKEQKQKDGMNDIDNLVF